MPRESEIISRLIKMARTSRDVPVGVGDDAAVIQFEGSADLVACCDISVEGIHFRTDWTSPGLVGRKSLAVTLSDVAAMGGKARYAMLSVAFPQSTSSSFVAELLQGIFDFAADEGISIVGGDTSASPGPLFIDTSVIGECLRGRAITRSGATPGERIYVTGSLGASSLGLILLNRGIRIENLGKRQRQEPERGAIQQAVFKHLVPQPHMKFGEAIGASGLATSMIDISDGLSTDLSHILDSSACGAILDTEAIPVAGSVRELSGADEKVDAMSLALHGGEEYELLFTARAADDDRLLDLAAAQSIRITAIGEITSGSGLYLKQSGKLKLLEPRGFEHQI